MFDNSIVALRQFSSSELLDAGFNVKVAADRQGHAAGQLGVDPDRRGPLPSPRALVTEEARHGVVASVALGELVALVEGDRHSEHR